MTTKSTIEWVNLALQSTDSGAGSNADYLKIGKCWYGPLMWCNLESLDVVCNCLSTPRMPL